MKSDTLAQLLDSLGASHSFSRPRVSNDNPQAEAQFKTMKYQPDYPGSFTGPPMARSWMGDYFGWHNNDHHHAGLALFTPADVFYGRVAEVAAIRQAALDAAYTANPLRFPNGPPRVTLPPAVVEINPIVTEAVELSTAGVDAALDANVACAMAPLPRAPLEFITTSTTADALLLLSDVRTPTNSQ